MLEFIIMKYVFALLILYSSSSYACKVRSSHDDYPVQELRNFEEVLVVDVLQTEQDEKHRHIKTESATVKVLQSLKGKIKANQKIDIKHLSENVSAVCPVFLKVGYIYLIPLKRTNEDYFYSRHSLIMSNINESNFYKIIKQIESGL